MHRAGDLIVGTVKDPRVLWRGSVRPSFLLGDARNYDRAARILLERAEEWARRKGKPLALERKAGRIEVSRVFQAPCPVTLDSRDFSARRDANRTRRARRKKRGAR